jgi:hypothetical protein
MKSGFVRAAGITVFAISFLLPALDLGGAPFSGRQLILYGWQCPLVVFTYLVPISTTTNDFVLVVTGILINPLVLTFLTLSVRERLPRMRVLIAVLLLLCIPSAWVEFLIMDIKPMAGFYAWVSGALLILIADLVSVIRAQALAKSTQNETDVTGQPKLDC